MKSFQPGSRSRLPEVPSSPSHPDHHSPPFAERIPERPPPPIPVRNIGGAASRVSTENSPKNIAGQFDFSPTEDSDEDDLPESEMLFCFGKNRYYYFHEHTSNI